MYAFYRLDNANIEVRGCEEHLKKLFAILGNFKQEAEERAKKKMKKYWKDHVKALHQIREEFTTGQRCLKCGDKLPEKEENFLSSWCGDCLED